MQNFSCKTQALITPVGIYYNSSGNSCKDIALSTCSFSPSYDWWRAADSCTTLSCVAWVCNAYEGFCSSSICTFAHTSASDIPHMPRYAAPSSESLDLWQSGAVLESLRYDQVDGKASFELQGIQSRSGSTVVVLREVWTAGHQRLYIRPLWRSMNTVKREGIKHFSPNFHW